jgi:hypothetical protein
MVKKTKEQIAKKLIEDKQKYLEAVKECKNAKDNIDDAAYKSAVWGYKTELKKFRAYKNTSKTVPVTETVYHIRKWVDHSYCGIKSPNRNKCADCILYKHKTEKYKRRKKWYTRPKLDKNGKCQYILDKDGKKIPRTYKDPSYRKVKKPFKFDENSKFSVAYMADKESHLEKNIKLVIRFFNKKWVESIGEEELFKYTWIKDSSLILSMARLMEKFGDKSNGLSLVKKHVKEVNKGFQAKINNSCNLTMRQCYNIGFNSGKFEYTKAGSKCQKSCCEKRSKIMSNFERVDTYDSNFYLDEQLRNCKVKNSWGVGAARCWTGSGRPHDIAEVCAEHCAKHDDCDGFVLDKNNASMVWKNNCYLSRYQRDNSGNPQKYKKLRRIDPQDLKRSNILGSICPRGANYCQMYRKKDIMNKEKKEMDRYNKKSKKMLKKYVKVDKPGEKIKRHSYFTDDVNSCLTNCNNSDSCKGVAIKKNTDGMGHTCITYYDKLKKGKKNKEYHTVLEKKDIDGFNVHEVYKKVDRNCAFYDYKRYDENQISIQQCQMRCLDDDKCLGVAHRDGFCYHGGRILEQTDPDKSNVCGKDANCAVYIKNTAGSDHSRINCKLQPETKKDADLRKKGEKNYREYKKKRDAKIRGTDFYIARKGQTCEDLHRPITQAECCNVKNWKNAKNYSRKLDSRVHKEHNRREEIHCANKSDNGPCNNEGFWTYRNGKGKNSWNLCKGHWDEIKYPATPKLGYGETCKDDVNCKNGNCHNGTCCHRNHKDKNCEKCDKTGYCKLGGCKSGYKWQSGSGCTKKSKIKTKKFKIVDNRGKRTYPKGCKLLTKVECCNSNNWKNASGTREKSKGYTFNPYCASKWQKKSNNDTDRCIKFPKSNYVYPRGYGTKGYVLCKA